MKKTTFLTALLLITTQVIFAQWDGNPAVVNNAVSNDLKDDRGIFSVTDGAGGAILAWIGWDNDSSLVNVYLQRKTSSGAVAWSTVSTPLFVFSSTTSALSYDGGIGDLVSDGAGGAYISFIDKLSNVTSNIFLQRVSHSGAILYTSGGIKINLTNGHEYSDAKMCADNAGVIICWTDQQLGNPDLTLETGKVFAQRYNLSGIAQWLVGGVQVSTAVGDKGFSEITSDGANGAFISFCDARNSSAPVNGYFDNIDIFAQHLSSTGSKLWGAQDVIVTTEPGIQYTLSVSDSRRSMIADSAGGFILIYRGSNFDVLYVQRLAANGTRLWATLGVPLVGVLPGYMGNCNISYSAQNGLIVVWDQFLFAQNRGDVHAQNITSGGLVNWGSNGILVSAPNIPNFYYNVGMSTMAADGSGNYVVNWTNYDTVNYHFEIKGQKLNSLGARLWGVSGVDICVNPLADAQLPVILRSSNDSMIVAWMDGRNNNFDIYSAKIAPNGNLISTYATIGNGNWNVPSIWSGNAVPPSGANVIIRHTVNANINVSCNSLKVEPGASFNINPGINITLLQ